MTDLPRMASLSRLRAGAANLFSGNLRPAEPPPRVQAAIAAQQDASERLIGWFQLAVVCVFGTLYALSPKTFAEDAAFAPVPWALGAYLAFTVIRLALAHRGRIGPAMLYASVVFDMSLLLGLIWSFHLQYGQPPSFYLKAPTLLYVFIFIALRALRFEARYVVAAGLAAAAGWFGFAWYAVAGAGGTVTRDYVLYMTSNSVLIGAEFDKIISILVVTAILAVAIGRARRLLIRSVAEGQAVQELSRFFSPEIAERIRASDEAVSAGSGQTRDAAILFCDIRGFTDFSHTHEPDEIIAMLTEYQRLLVPILQENDGAIDKFMGDGIMATFGAALPSATHAADACRAVDALMAAADRWNRERAAGGRPELRVGAAVAAGRMIFGAVGNENRLEYTVIGDAVNLAAKLEKATKAERCRALTTRETYEAARAQGYRPAGGELQILAGRNVEGIDKPIDLAVLAG